MNLLSLRTLLASFTSHRAAEPAAHGAAACSTESTRHTACGWFDSSHELQHGLWVQEHAGPDTLAQELPLAGWLELHLSGWGPPQPGHAAT